MSDPQERPTAEDDAPCVVCDVHPARHGGLCCFHRYDEQPLCDSEVCRDWITADGHACIGDGCPSCAAALARVIQPGVDQ